MELKKILIVEDNTTIAEDYRYCLEKLGYIITSIVSSGEESIKRAETEHPDAVIMDIKLQSDMDGIEAAKQIFSRFEIPVIFLSAFSDESVLKRAVQTGSFAFLVKPFEERELHATLEMVLCKSEAGKVQKKLESHLLHQQRMESIGSLAGGIAHDFNNLLSVILGNLSLALKSFDIEPQLSKYIKNAQRASVQAIDLSSKLLTFTTGGNPVKKPVSLEFFLKTSISSLLKKTSVKSDYIIPETLSMVQIDELLMKQVIDNIVVNAVKSMNGNGKLEISAENKSIEQTSEILKPGKYVKISIKDYGSGISGENLSKIFDPYFTAEKKGAEKGIGLGLSICHSIIEKHKGFITAESEYGISTTIIIYLPAADTVSPKKDIISRPEKKRKQLEKQSILIMDDEPMIRDLIGYMLKNLNYKSEVCNNGEEAIEKFKKAREEGRPFDVVILDLTIQFGMGGKNTIRELLKIDPDIKAIVSSGFSFDPVIEHYKDYGFSLSLSKPYTIENLKTAMKEILSDDKND